MRWAALWLLVSFALVGCGSHSPPAGPASGSRSLAFESGDVTGGQPIDPRFSCDGEGRSPALRWSGVPTSAKSLALLLEDPDAPGGTFTHWIVYRLAPQVTSLAAGVPPNASEWHGSSFRQGVNQLGRNGYSGPCPPRGQTHRYVFRLLALDTTPSLPAGASRAELDRAVEGHTIAEARMTATYSRS